MKQSGIEANAHVCIQAWAIFVYDCAVFGDTLECVYEVLVHAFFYCLFYVLDHSIFFYELIKNKNK